MNQQRSTFIVGLTSLLALVGIVALLMLFGELDRFLARNYVVLVHTDNAGGLRPGSDVALNGVLVGQIDEIGLQDDPVYPVRAVALIERRHRIPAHTTFLVDRNLIGGSSTLSLLAAGPPGEFLPDDDTAELRGLHLTVLEQMSEALTERFEPLMTAMEAFESFAETYRRLGESLDDLITAPDDGAGLRAAITRLNTLLDQTTETAAQAERWFGDDRLQQAVTDAAERVGPTLDRYEQLAATLETQATSVATDLAQVTDDLSTTLDQVRRAATTVNEGDGTVSRLLNNPDLYNSLTDTTEQLQRTLEEIELLIQKIKAEGVPVRL